MEGSRGPEAQKPVPRTELDLEIRQNSAGSPALREVVAQSPHHHRSGPIRTPSSGRLCSQNLSGLLSVQDSIAH